MSFTLPAHRLSDTIRSATNFFFARVDSFDNSLSVSARVGGCDVVPDLSRSESAVTQQNVRKSFRIRTYDKPQGGGVVFQSRISRPPRLPSREVAITSRQPRKAPFNLRFSPFNARIAASMQFVASSWSGW